jgi:hypothetical protein
MGNYHARFLGGNGAERPPLYPVILPGKDTYNMLIIKEQKAKLKPCLLKMLPL